MIRKIFFLPLVLMLAGNTLNAQINNHGDYIEKLQELRTISQKLGIYYIMNELYRTNENFEKKKNENIERFTNLIVELTENAPDEELQIELNKLNLTWLYVNKLLNKPYERALAGKILDKLEEMQQEIYKIIDKYMHFTKEKQAQMVQKAADTRVQIQRMLLYYLAKRANVLNPEIPRRFKESKNLFKQELAELERSEYNDESTMMILDMIKNQFRTLRNLELNTKINPLTAVMIAERMDEDLKMLVKTYRLSLR